MTDPSAILYGKKPKLASGAATKEQAPPAMASDAPPEEREVEVDKITLEEYLNPEIVEVTAYAKGKVVARCRMTASELSRAKGGVKDHLSHWLAGLGYSVSSDGRILARP